MPKAVICAYARTPIGKFRGALANYSATELGAKVVKELLKRVEIDPKSGIVDQVTSVKYYKQVPDKHLQDK